MILRQLFEPISSTRLLGCEATGQAVLIDPVISGVERDLEEVHRLGLRLAYTWRLVPIPVKQYLQKRSKTGLNV